MDMHQKFIMAVEAAYKAVSDHQEEINKLNVFPIPDGDTGTNVTLTMQNVVKELHKLPANPSKAQILRAVKQGSLMGARGNSGVITSQILRGLTEGIAECNDFDSNTVATALLRARDVAYKAVRKPVEGTILTVIKDMAEFACEAAADGLSAESILSGVANESMESVRRTPELMATLKENGVVDSGGLALATMTQGFVESFLDTTVATTHDSSVFRIHEGAKVAIEQEDDWENHNFRYCTEFLFKSDTIDVEEAYTFLESMGDCQLVVGEHPDFKIHVHTDQPGIVLTWMIERGQPHEIFIHNMDMQSEERLEKIEADEAAAAAVEQPAGPKKELGMVAVAVGEGNIAILESLGVDRVVSGGQTMNPSTSDIVEAVNAVNAESVVVFPGNKNIIMSANAATGLANKPCAVVPTTSTPQTFTAIVMCDASLPLEENVAGMTAAMQQVTTGEITTAVKDAVGDDGLQICEGDVMGIVNGHIKLVGNDVYATCMEVIDRLASGEDVCNLTLLAGADLPDDQFERIQQHVQEEFPDIECDAHRGGQPLYPLILAVE